MQTKNKEKKFYLYVYIYLLFYQISHSYVINLNYIIDCTISIYNFTAHLAKGMSLRFIKKRYSRNSTLLKI